MDKLLYGEKQYIFKNGLYEDSNFLELFKKRLDNGDLAKALEIEIDSSNNIKSIDNTEKIENLENKIVNLESIITKFGENIKDIENNAKAQATIVSTEKISNSTDKDKNEAVDGSIMTVSKEK